MDLKKLIDINFNLHSVLIPEMNSGMNVFKHPGFSFVDSGILSDSFNILHIYDAALVVSANLKSAIEYYKHRNLPFCIWANEDQANTAIRNILEKRSVIEVNKEPGMSLDLDKFDLKEANTDLVIEKAYSREHILHFGTTLAANLRPPDKNVIGFFTKTSPDLLRSKSSIYILYHDQLPVSVIEAFPSDDETVGIYNLTTLKEFRRKGFAARLLNHALSLAKLEGFKNSHPGEWEYYY